MGLSDPFSTTYQGSMQAGESLGQGIQQAAGSVADVMKQKAAVQQQAKQREQAFGLLKQFGLVKQNQPTNDDLADGLKKYGEQAGVQVNVNHGDNPDQERKNMIGIYKAMGIPMPKGKIDVMPGTTIDMGGGTSYTAPKSGDELTGELKRERLDTIKQAQEDRKEKKLSNLGTDLDPTKFRQGIFGQEAQTFDRGEALQSLMNQASTQVGGADTRQIVEAAIGLQNMLSRGNSSVTEVMQLVPQSAQGNVQKMTEWLTNNPTGLDQQKFTDRLKDTINRELNTSQSQMNRVKYRRLSKYDDLRKQDPDGWERIVRANGVNPDDYDSWVKGGYKNISAIQGGSQSVLNAAGMNNKQSGMPDVTKLSDDDLRRIANGG